MPRSREDSRVLELHRHHLARRLPSRWARERLACCYYNATLYFLPKKALITLSTPATIVRRMSQPSGPTSASIASAQSNEGTASRCPRTFTARASSLHRGYSREDNPDRNHHIALRKSAGECQRDQKRGGPYDEC
jgi:hypothetical protein